MIDMSCNSGQHVIGLRNFFFVLQDLIDRIHSYFQRIAFPKNLLLTRYVTSFSDENKEPSLKWRCVNLQGEIMAENRRRVSNIKISILFQSILEKRRISLSSLYNPFKNKISVVEVELQLKIKSIES